MKQLRLFLGVVLLLVFVSIPTVASARDARPQHGTTESSSDPDTYVNRTDCEAAGYSWDSSGSYCYDTSGDVEIEGHQTAEDTNPDSAGGTGAYGGAAAHGGENDASPDASLNPDEVYTPQDPCIDAKTALDAAQAIYDDALAAYNAAVATVTALEADGKGGSMAATMARLQLVRAKAVLDGATSSLSAATKAYTIHSCGPATVSVHP